MYVALKHKSIMNQQVRVGTFTVKYTHLFSGLEVVHGQALAAVFRHIVASRYLDTRIRMKNKAICYDWWIKVFYSDVAVKRKIYRELKQIMTTTATKTSLNKRFNEPINSCARLL